jgi:hypothetical protein
MEMMNYYYYLIFIVNSNNILMQKLNLILAKQCSIKNSLFKNGNKLKF